MCKVNNITINDNKKVITINDLSKVTPKKISGTNFGVILGVNTFSTPFQAWCDMMKVYKKPFVETDEMRAGKEIEHKQAAYIKEKYGLVGLTSPAEKYGENYFIRTRGDFFPMEDYFQGMWDFINVDPTTNKTTSIIEMKTTKEKNKEKWKEQIPPYYMLQTALYTYLSKIDKFVVVATFLKPEDYENPVAFKPNDENTIVRPFKLSENMPNFYEYYVKPAQLWWDKYIVTGVSPEYDEFNAGDIEIVKSLLKEQREAEQKKNELKGEIKLTDISTNDIFY